MSKISKTQYSEESDSLNHPFHPQNESQQNNFILYLQSQDDLEEDQDDQKDDKVKPIPIQLQQPINSFQKAEPNSKTQNYLPDKKIADFDSQAKINVPKTKNRKNSFQQKQKTEKEYKKSKLLEKLSEKKLQSSQRFKNKEDEEKIEKIDSLQQPNREREKKSKQQGLNQEDQKPKKNKTITQIQYDQMTAMFKAYKSKTPYEGKQIKSLVSIARELKLDQTTVSTRYPHFNQTNEIKKGVRIVPEGVKVQYNKTTILKQYVRKALGEGKKFQNHQSLAEYITDNYNHQTNKRMIQRVLLQMKEEKNIYQKRKKQLKSQKSST